MNLDRQDEILKSYHDQKTTSALRNDSPALKLFGLEGAILLHNAIKYVHSKKAISLFDYLWGYRFSDRSLSGDG